MTPPEIRDILFACFKALLLECSIAACQECAYHGDQPPPVFPGCLGSGSNEDGTTSGHAWARVSLVGGERTARTSWDNRCMPTRAVVELGVVRCITAVGDPNTDTPPSCAQYLVDVERGDADMMAAIGVPTCTMALDAGISVLGWSWVPIGPVADNLDEGSNRACAGGAITIQVSLGGEETLDGDADVIESGEGFSG